jgi:hypothetical protein
MTHVVYNSDDGNAYKIRVAAWQATLTGDTAATTEPALPKGYKPRRRYYRITASGREGHIVVGAVTSAIWTGAPGTAVTTETGVFGSTGVAGTLQGSTGERRKVI